MRGILLSTLALGAMTTAAAAEPRAMSDGQLAGVAAGVVTVAQGITQRQVANGLALDLSGNSLPVGGNSLPVNGGGSASVTIDQNQDAVNTATVDLTRVLTEVVPQAATSSNGNGSFQHSGTFSMQASN